MVRRLRRFFWEAEALGGPASRGHWQNEHVLVSMVLLWQFAGLLEATFQTWKSSRRYTCSNISMFFSTEIRSFQAGTLV